MSEFAQSLTQYATPEVFTVLAALITLYAGWKATGYASKKVGSIAKKCSFSGIAATALMLSGLGAMGFGIGEITGRDAPVVEQQQSLGLANAELLALAKQQNLSPDVTKLLLDYARSRDGHTDSVESMAKLIEGLPKEGRSMGMTPEEFSAFKLVEQRQKRLDEQHAELVSLLKKPGAEEVDPRLLAYVEEPISLEEPFEVVGQPAVASDPDSYMPIPLAWVCILVGMGGVIAGTMTYKNRNLPYNPQDPHAPQPMMQTANHRQLG